MTDGKQQVNFTVDAEAYDRAKNRTKHGEISSKLRQTIEETAYGAEITERKRLKEKLADLQAEKRDINNQIDQLRADRNELDRKITRTEDRLEAIRDDEGEYEGFLQAIETDLHEGMRADPQHGKVERAAEKGNCEVADVICALKERNSDVPEVAFRLPDKGEDPNWKKETGWDYR